MNRALTAVLAAAFALAPSGAQAGTPAEGVSQTIRSGFFADVNLGGFFTASGSNGVSNAQAFLQLGIGYDVLKAVPPDDRFGMAVGLTFGLGSSAASCFASVTASGNCVFDPAKNSLDAANVAPDNFTVTMVGGEVIFKIKLLERFYLRPRVLVGYAFLDPKPIADLGATFYAGAAAGVEYATHLDHFSVGVDVETKLIIGPNIPAFALYPMIKYTF